MWAKLQFFKKGIGPSEFKKCQMRDIKDVLGISLEINLKQMREQEIQRLMAQQNG